MTERDWQRVLGIALAIAPGIGITSSPALAVQPAVAHGTSIELAAPGQPAWDIDEDSAKARAALIEQLEGLAEWCTKKKIYLKRQEVYLSILHFDPDSNVARRGLGYVKDSEGNWIEKKRRVEPKDWDKGAVKEFPEKRTEVAEAYRTAMFGLIDKYEGRLSPTQREKILDDLLFADPDDPRVHALRGEVKVDDKWVLVQTVKAKEHRAELRDMVRKAFKNVPKAEEDLANAREDQFGIGWKAIYKTPIVRSLGTGSAKEVERMTQAMAATLSYFNDALSVEAHFPKDFTVYTLARSGDKMAFLMNHPAVDQTYRDFLFQLDGSGIQGSGDLAHWSEEPTRRLDGLVRQAIAWLFAEGYGILPKTGWVFEGVGIYMTRELVGTRLTWYVRPSEYLVEADDNALKQRLLDTRTNWMNEARLVLAGEKRPKLGLLLGRDVNQLTTEDLLYSYVLSAYLLEAESEKFPTILTKIGEGQTSVETLESVLEMDLPELEERLIRWLNERQ